MGGPVDRFLDAARALGIEPEVRRFPQGTKTAADAAAAIGCEIGQIVKSLVFRAGDEPLLALTSGSNRADTERLRGLAGAAPVRRATPEQARDATGFAIGGTPPFGHPRPPRVVVERDLIGYEVVWAAAGTPTRSSRSARRSSSGSRAGRSPTSRRAPDLIMATGAGGRNGLKGRADPTRWVYLHERFFTVERGT